jgi:tRNA (guanine37-N1)-methyltransferase
MRFDVITLFPELFEPFLKLGVTRRAYESKQVDVRLWPLRDFGEGTHQRVDDRPFGGGPGMVLLAEPLERAVNAVQRDRADDVQLVIHFTPTGRHMDQEVVCALAGGGGATLVCGRYEGIDQRFLDRHVTLELSLGDFVLSGGELPALALLDAVARLQPGVLGDEQSAEQDSFGADGCSGLLDCPHYSRPETFGGDAVPAVLMSGHHAQIERWRRERSLELTARRRPELIAAARAAGRLSKADETFLAALHL